MLILDGYQVPVLPLLMMGVLVVSDSDWRIEAVLQNAR